MLERFWREILEAQSSINAMLFNALFIVRINTLKVFLGVSGSGERLGFTMYLDSNH